MSHHLTKEELDEQFEQFLKESVSDDSVASTAKKPSVLDSLGKAIQKTAKKPAASTVPWWQDDDSLGGPGRGLLGSGKTFRKSLRKSQPIQEEDEDCSGDKGLCEEERMEPGVLSRDSLEQGSANSAVAPGPVLNTVSLGMDTLEEEEEKARFFARLEAGASSTLDYSKLNRDLDSTSSTTGTALREAVEQAEDDQTSGGVMEADRISPGSPHYSEDFEDEGRGQDSLTEKPERSPMLAKVSLHDSLDSTGGFPTPREDEKRDPAESPDKAQSYGQSGGSEMEALHKAYRQISLSVADSEDPHSHLPSSTERRERSSNSPPEHYRGEHQPASTAETELPTAEELMRTIRPETEHIRGFTLQPVSRLELDAGETDGSSERRSPESKPDPAVGMQRSTTPPPPAPPPPSHSSDLPFCDLRRSIREEVQRLMQDQDNPFPVPSVQGSKAKKQQRPHGLTISGPSTSSARKATVAPVRGRRAETRSTVASRFSGLNRPGAATKPLSPLNQKKPLSQDDSPPKNTDSSLKVSSELIASVQSFAAFLQHQIDTSSCQATTVTQEVKGHQGTGPTQHLTAENRQAEEEEGEGEERSLADGLRVQLAQKERDMHIRVEQLMQLHKEELSSLKQNNYLLQSKLRSAEDASQKKTWGKATDPLTKERLQVIEKEMQEQETLIQGYHQENEKLYLQMKAQQAQSKANEEAMFTENQRLLNELALAKEQLTKNPKTLGNICSMDHAQRITELLTQMDTIQRSEAKLSEETRRLKQEKQAFEVDLRLMKKERDLAKAQVVSTSGDKSLEMRVQEDRHREEVAALNKKLQWYAENQELLDRDAARLRAATAETHKLKEQVERLKLDVGKRGSQPQSKTKERAGDAKRIQDLERQVKELEEILRHRHPNSLPALMYAAASAFGTEDHDSTKTSPPARFTALLERRIQRLEAELESRDEEAKRSLRAMEQQFQRIKLRYEQQISGLEQQLAQVQQLAAASSPSEAQESRVRALEEELQRVKDAHHNRETELQQQLQSLQQELTHKQAQPTEPERAQRTEPGRAQRSPSRHQRQAEAALGGCVDRLNRELAAKTRAVQELTRTVERLQRERRTMLSVPSPRQEARSGDTRRQGAPSKTPSSAGPGEGRGGEEVFPVAQYEKTYQPTAFTGSHITEVLQENQGLREGLEQLELQREQERAALQATVAQAQAELCRLKDRSGEQLTSLRAEHLKELNRLRASHTLDHSKVAELTNKVNTQEIMVQHLRNQVKELQGAKDALAVSKIREDTLQNQLTKLLEELKQAKEAHSPELKHLCSLERKIHDMELRHTQREKELQQVIGQTRQVVEAEQQSEVERWRSLAQGKSRELEAFRQELDSILDVLREFHKQGVVIPSRNLSINTPSTWKS
ncbi:centrosomal protein of 162 kDa [Polymixia lowei]